MRGVLKVVAVAVGFLVLLAGCTTPFPRPLHPGEMKLTRMLVSGSVEEGLPYDVVVNFKASGQPRIKSVCLQWLDQKVDVKSPSLYCFAYEAQKGGSSSVGSACNKWLAEGPYSHISPMFCVPPKVVNYDETPSNLVISLRTRNVKPYYNKLRCFVEYIQDGQLVQSNKVSASIRVGDY